MRISDTIVGFMTQTDTQYNGLVVPSGAEIYDSIMSKINPDLLIANLDSLDAKYANESSEDRKARYAHYEKSYAAYDKAFAEWTKELSTAVTKYKHDALKSAEAQTKVEEGEKLSALETQFDS